MARKPKTTKPAVAQDGVAPVKAVHRINGTILPGTIFTPKTETQRDELLALGAVAELDAVETKLFAAETPVVDPDPEPEPESEDTGDTDSDEIA